MIQSFECRVGCAACCIAPSISSAIPGIENGKPAGVPCVQLDERGLCRIFGDSRRPGVCGSLRPSLEMCGGSLDVHVTRAHAMRYLTELDLLTRAQRVDE